MPKRPTMNMARREEAIKAGKTYFWDLRDGRFHLTYINEPQSHIDNLSRIEHALGRMRGVTRRTTPELPSLRRSYDRICNVKTTDTERIRQNKYRKAEALADHLEEFLETEQGQAAIAESERVWPREEPVLVTPPEDYIVHEDGTRSLPYLGYGFPGRPGDYGVETVSEVQDILAGRVQPTDTDYFDDSDSRLEDAASEYRDFHRERERDFAHAGADSALEYRGMPRNPNYTPRRGRGQLR